MPVYTPSHTDNLKSFLYQSPTSKESRAMI